MRFSGIGQALKEPKTAANIAPETPTPTRDTLAARLSRRRQLSTGGLLRLAPNSRGGAAEPRPRRPWPLFGSATSQRATAAVLQRAARRVRSAARGPRRPFRDVNTTRSPIEGSFAGEASRTEAFIAVFRLGLSRLRSELNVLHGSQRAS